ncbi:hypothetical protein BDZ45DRAFT_804898 [Acephala macrosclerotiorum]|nr:hypothetical protein BDZ45DRAFT_804898 [Acephala macrosclerotiorum]
MTNWDHPYELKKTMEIIGHLPGGWMVKLADGREYFVNHKDRITSWVCPSTAGVVALTDMIRSESGKSTHWTFPGEIERIVQVTGPLSDGCKLRLSPFWRYYLVDHKTRAPRWLEKLETPMRSHDMAVLDPVDGFGPLPNGSIERQTLDGTVVFVD